MGELGAFLKIERQDPLERDPNMPRTSQPSPGLFARAYQRLVDEGATEILSIHLSAKLSGTMESARQGAQGIEDVRIEHLDSNNVSLALGVGVMEAAKVARAGGTLDEAMTLAAERMLIRRSRRLTSSCPASWTIARATNTRWRCPPESSPNRAPATCSRPTRASARRARRRSRAPGRRHHGVPDRVPINTTSVALTG